MNKRPSWDSYFTEMAKLVATRATCNRAQHGCVLVRDKQVLATGYNGSPPGEPHCTDPGVGCLIVDGHCKRCFHAEDNAITQALSRGISLRGATAYVTGTPCEFCASKLIAAGVSRVVYAAHYGGSRAPELFEQAGVKHALMGQDPKEVDWGYSQVQFLDYLAQIRELLLGAFDEGHPLYEKWLGPCVGDPGEIVGLAADVARLIARREAVSCE